jgi:hypothetical protein
MPGFELNNLSRKSANNFHYLAESSPARQVELRKVEFALVFCQPILEGLVRTKGTGGGEVARKVLRKVSLKFEHVRDFFSARESKSSKLSSYETSVVNDPQFHNRKIHQIAPVP